MRKIILTLLSIIITTSLAHAGTFKADAKTKRIAAGTPFTLEFLQPISTFSGTEGDSFSAILKNEIKTNSSVILPIGSVIRGSISNVNTAKRFSRGAKLYLDFDHVVTPNGRQIPLDLAVSRINDTKIFYDGGLYKNLGYGEAIKENFDRGVNITKLATEYGLKAGDTAQGLQYITTPFCAIGGFIGGLGYFVGTDVADMFKKGNDVYINKGEIIEVRLLNPIDVPVY